MEFKEKKNTDINKSRRNLMQLYMKKFSSFWIILILCIHNLKAQNNTKEELRDLLYKDTTTIPFLFSYPDSIRSSILVVSTYPQGMVQIEELQKKSSAAFKKSIAHYNRTKQKQLWELTRYSDLTALLVNNQNQTDESLKEILKNYPDEIKKSAIYFTKHDITTIIAIDSIRKEFDEKYKESIKHFPEDVKKSFSTILQKPELLSALNQEIKTTITLGNLYKNDPAAVKQFSDSINKLISEQTSKEYEDWKTGINKNPEVQKELKQIAGKYQEENSFSDDVYDNNKAEISVYYIPYPYWAGYPYWYERPYWYPYPWWYQIGFYWSPGGPIIFNGMPTYYFGWWYWHHPHHYFYPHTNQYFHQHYQIYRRSHQGFNQSIRESQPVIKRKR